MSGRNSVEQDEALVERMHRTPQAPMKMSSAKHLVSSAQRRRCLFKRSVSPTSSDASDGLGHMSPLSSSLESLPSIDSPLFSPDGRLATPEGTPKTPKRPTPVRPDITVRSTLFPTVKTYSPSVRRSPRSAKKSNQLVALEQMISDTPVSCSQVTTPRSSRRTNREIIAETSPSSVGTPPSQRKPNTTFVAESPSKPSSPPFDPVPETSFYGPPKSAPTFHKPSAPGGKTDLIIDTFVGRRSRINADALRKNFVVGASKRRRSTSRSTSRSRKQRKGVIPGVWHGIKKPKKMKKSVPKPKPALSPNTRSLTVMAANKTALNKGREVRRLFEEKPRNRVVKRQTGDDENDILDSFPGPRIKRKKLPATPEKEQEPDPSKKFFKWGYRKATCTLHDNVEIQYSNGKMRLKIPKKPRPVRTKKLYTPSLDIIDFNEEPEPETAKIQESVDNILQNLDIDPASPPRPVQVSTLSDDQLLSILESPSTKVTLIETTPGLPGFTEIHSSPQRNLLRNLSNLNIQGGTGETELGNTGCMVSSAANLLNSGEEFAQTSPDGSQPKLYPVFNKENWPSAPNTGAANGTNAERRKNVLFREDQYLLDAGQKSIGVVKCRECGVMYQQGDYLDELAHYNVHNHIAELRFLSWKEERVVSRYSEGRIVLVTAADSKPWQIKAGKVVGVVDKDLQFSESNFKWTPDKKVYMFVNEKLKLVVGCLVAENCTKGYRMYPAIEGVEIDTCARDPSPCKFGVSRVWTLLPHRRTGVASRLFACARRLAGDVAPDDVAFSIPTPDGKSLARALVGRDDFKVYGFIND